MADLMIKGEAFNVVVEGEADAPALVLAHPLGANLNIFDPLMPELLRHFRVVRYDARGHGSSVVSQGPYALAELGADALGILDALQIEKAHWLGVSMGGITGMSVLTQAPQRIGRAVLANVTAHFGSADSWNERIRTITEKGMQGLLPTVLENWFTKGFRESHAAEVERISQMLLAAPVEGYAGACAALRDMDLREAIRAIRNRVLVIVGRQDTVTTAGLGALVASATAGAKLVTLETAHMSCVEDPKGFNQAVIEFLTTEAPMMEDEPEHVPTVEPAQPPAPPKKPKKPKEPHAEGHGDMFAQPAPMLAPAHAEEAEEEGHATIAPAPGPRKRAVKKAPAKKAAAKKTAARKAPAKKAPAKKAAAKKSTARKTVGKKTAAKKSARKAARKAVAKKTVAKKAAAKRGAAKKAPLRKSAAKKGLVRKAVVKKTVAKKAVRKSAAKKAAGRKPMPRHMPGRRPTRKR